MIRSKRLLRRRRRLYSSLPESMAGVIDLSPLEPVILHSGSVSLKGALPEGEEWSAPAWKPPAYSKESENSGNRSDLLQAKSISLAQKLAIVLQPPLSLVTSDDGPLRWPSPLHDFQKTGIGVLMGQPSVLLADDMGLGKTIQATATMRLLAHRREIERILIVAPMAVVRNWRIELNRWAPELRVIEITGTQTQRIWKWDARVHVKIVSYETLRSDAKRVLSRHSQWDLVCLDEAQRIKNAGSEISAVVKKIEARRRWALTGTPLENSLDDVWSIISFLQPGQTDGADIRESLSRVQLRRRKMDVLTDLPPKTTMELFVQLSRPQKDEYDMLLKNGVSELKSKGPDATVTDVLALITRLKQVCNFASANGRSSKMEDIAARLEILRQEGHKALVFSQFTSESYGVRHIAKALDAYGSVIYTGDMSMDERRLAISKFQSDPGAGALILSLKAGGVGLNLQQASYIFHFDRWWNPASEAQAEDRSHRIGQTRGVSVYKYICVDTIEERIHNILQAKRALFDEYVDDVCLEIDRGLSEEELFGLFDLQSPPSAAGKRP